MQTLDSEQLEYAFAVHGISREGHARTFYGDLWNLIQAAEKIRDPLSLSKCQTEVRHLCNAYFSIMREWQQEEEEKHEGEPACTASKENAREAKSILLGFEKNFIRYALCYLELNRALIQVRGTLAVFTKDYNINDISKQAMQINHGTGALLQRALRERKSIMEKRLRLERVKMLLQHFDPLMEFLGDALPRLLGQEEGDRQVTIFKAYLRKCEFDKAKRTASFWGPAALRETGFTLIKLASENQTELAAQDGIMLHSGELSLINSFLKGDESRINQFLEKYNVPYMVFQYQNLLHQGYLLGRVGSIEALIIQHAKLLSIAARPHNDPPYAKIQEDAVLVPVRVLMQEKFKSLPEIFDGMETTIAILEKLFVQTREYLAQTPSQIQN